MYHDNNLYDKAPINMKLEKLTVNAEKMMLPVWDF
jgi:hypothetical protein